MILNSLVICILAKSLRHPQSPLGAVFAPSDQGFSILQKAFEGSSWRLENNTHLPLAHREMVRFNTSPHAQRSTPPHIHVLPGGLGEEAPHRKQQFPGNLSILGSPRRIPTKPTDPPGRLPKTSLGSPEHPRHHCPHVFCETRSACSEPKARSLASNIPTWTKQLPVLPSKSYLITGSTIKEASEPEKKGLADSGQSIHHSEQFCRGASAADSSPADTPVLLPCQHQGCLLSPGAQTLQR